MNEPVVRIQIVAYDPTWPAQYEDERQRVARAMAILAPRIEHIGSTAVPGLAAKPIIDLLVIVDRLESPERYGELLGSLGYAYFAVLGNHERHSFGRGTPHTHHIHVVQAGSEEHARPIAFRDYLRAHPEVARRYGELKRTLAARYAHDRQGYVDAKTEFIRETVARADMWGSSLPGDRDERS